MDRLFYFLGDIQHTKLGGADSFSDQLNCKYTVYVLTLFAVLATAKMYVDDPISCFCPANFADSHVNYAEKFCWSTNTHYQPFEKDLPKESERKNYISYYQWIPMFLTFQAIFFYLPRVIWRMLGRKSGVIVYNITDAAIECQRKTDQDGVDKSMQYMTNYINRFLEDARARRDKPTRFHYFRRINSAYYLTGAYLFVKLLYAANSVGQLFLVNVFLGTDYHFYGFDVLTQMFSGQDWTTSHRFPRVTICDFQIRVLNNIHRSTVQCALPMNLYNEMMFIFLWFWFVYVSAVTVGSLVYWTAILIGVRQQVNFVRPRLAATGKFDEANGSRQSRLRKKSLNTSNSDNGNGVAVRIAFPSTPGIECNDVVLADESVEERRGGLKDISRFADSYLMRDGCLIVRLVAENSSHVIAVELLSRLYDNYAKSESGKPQPPSN